MISSLSLQAQFKSAHNLYFLLQNYALSSLSLNPTWNSKGTRRHPRCPSAMWEQGREVPECGALGRGMSARTTPVPVVGQGLTEPSPGPALPHGVHFKRWIQVPFPARVSECLHAERCSTWHLAAMLLRARLILHKACGNQNVPVTGVNLCLMGTDLESGHNLLFLIANIFLWSFMCRWAGASLYMLMCPFIVHGFPSSSMTVWWGFVRDSNWGVRAVLTKTTWSLLGNGIDFF